MNDSAPPAIDLVKLFHDGIWNSSHQRQLSDIGDELDKVRRYANEMQVDDLLSKTIVYLTASSYFAGLVPIIRIESALFVEKEFRNEYAYALSVRALIEVTGRLHKGLRLWRQFKSQRATLDDFSAGVQRLMAKFQPDADTPGGMFKGKGFNVMSLVQSLCDKMPKIDDVYGNLSSYVHGGFEEQMLIRKMSWVSDLKRDPNPYIESYESVAIELRNIAFDDFAELLQITRPMRERYDAGRSDSA